MPKKTELEKVVEKAIRSTLAELDKLEPPVRMTAIKLGIDFLKVQNHLDQDKFGSAFDIDGDSDDA